MYILPPTVITNLIPDSDHIPTPVLHARQQTTTTTVVAVTTTAAATSNAATCPGQYSGGTLAGAILGTFFGTLFVLYLFSIINMGGFTFQRIGKEEVIVEKRTRTSGGGSRRSSVRRPSRVYSPRD